MNCPKCQMPLPFDRLGVLRCYNHMCLEYALTANVVQPIDTEKENAMKRKYNVPIAYRGLANFLVEANSAKEAMQIARKKFENGETEDYCGNETEEVTQVYVPEEI